MDVTGVVRRIVPPWRLRPPDDPGLAALRRAAMVALVMPTASGMGLLVLRNAPLSTFIASGVSAARPGGFWWTSAPQGHRLRVGNRRRRWIGCHRHTGLHAAVDCGAGHAVRRLRHPVRRAIRWLCADGTGCTAAVIRALRGCPSTTRGARSGRRGGEGSAGAVVAIEAYCPDPPGLPWRRCGVPGLIRGAWVRLRKDTTCSWE
jgi:hypothetical protein